MISAKDAKQLTNAASKLALQRGPLLASLDSVIDRWIREAAKEGSDGVEVKFEHAPTEVNVAILLIDNLRSLGFYAKGFFNQSCTESKIVIGWNRT